jgi:hypothetical protein
MIITIEAIEGNSGQGQPVFSRTGITTVYQHKVFQENPGEHGEEEDEDLVRERKRKKKSHNQVLTAVSSYGE